MARGGDDYRRQGVALRLFPIFDGRGEGEHRDGGRGGAPLAATRRTVLAAGGRGPEARSPRGVWGVWGDLSSGFFAPDLGGSEAAVAGVPGRRGDRSVRSRGFRARRPGRRSGDVAVFGRGPRGAGIRRNGRQRAGGRRGGTEAASPEAWSSRSSPRGAEEGGENNGVHHGGEGARQQKRRRARRPRAGSGVPPEAPCRRPGRAGPRPPAATGGGRSVAVSACVRSDHPGERAGAARTAAEVSAPGGLAAGGARGGRRHRGGEARARLRRARPRHGRRAPPRLVAARGAVLRARARPPARRARARGDGGAAQPKRPGGRDRGRSTPAAAARVRPLAPRTPAGRTVAAPVVPEVAGGRQGCEAAGCSRGSGARPRAASPLGRRRRRRLGARPRRRSPSAPRLPRSRSLRSRSSGPVGGGGAGRPVDRCTSPSRPRCRASPLTVASDRRG